MFVETGMQYRVMDFLQDQNGIQLSLQKEDYIFLSLKRSGCFILSLWSEL